MNYQGALDLIKIGRKLTWRPWGNKATFVVLMRGNPEGVPADARTAAAMKVPEKTIIKVAPYLLLRTALGQVMPYTPTQEEMLGNLWEEVEED